jgi:hypothetical protein
MAGGRIPLTSHTDERGRKGMQEHLGAAGRQRSDRAVKCSAYGMLHCRNVGRPARSHAGRQPDGAQRVRDRPGQEAQARARLPSNGRHAGQVAPGRDVIIAGSVSNDDPQEGPRGRLGAPRPYISVVPQPPLTGDRDRRGATANVRKVSAGPSTLLVHPFPLALVYVDDERRGDTDEHPV